MTKPTIDTEGLRRLHELLRASNEDGLDATNEELQTLSSVTIDWRDLQTMALRPSFAHRVRRSIGVMPVLGVSLLPPAFALALARFVEAFRTGDRIEVRLTWLAVLLTLAVAAMLTVSGLRALWPILRRGQRWEVAGIGAFSATITLAIVAGAGPAQLGIGLVLFWLAPAGLYAVHNGGNSRRKVSVAVGCILILFAGFAVFSWGWVRRPWLAQDEALRRDQLLRDYSQLVLTDLGRRLSSDRVSPRQVARSLSLASASLSGKRPTADRWTLEAIALARDAQVARRNALEIELGRERHKDLREIEALLARAQRGELSERELSERLNRLLARLADRSDAVARAEAVAAQQVSSVRVIFTHEPSGITSAVEDDSGPN